MVVVELLAFADLHGEFKALFDFLTKVRRNQGRFAGALSVGDLFCYQCLACRNPGGYHRNNCPCRHANFEWAHHPFRTLEERLRPAPPRFPVPVYSVDGNGEETIQAEGWPAFYKEVPGLENLHYLPWSRPVRVAGLLVLGVPYNLTGGDAPGEKCFDARRVDAFTERVIATHGRPHVVLSHQPPKGVADVSFAAGTKQKRSLGSRVVRRVLERLRPELAICGHLHYLMRGRLGATRVVTLQRPAYTHWYDHGRRARHFGNYLALKLRPASSAREIAPARVRETPSTLLVTAYLRGRVEFRLPVPLHALPPAAPGS